MKTTPKIKHLTLACLLVVTSMMINSVGAAESDFQTKEYFASNGLDLINAASAYTQGFTGEGVLIGLLDTPMREDHPELSGKFEVVGALDEVGNSVPIPTTWTQDVSHGTHVASIMAAKKTVSVCTVLLLTAALSDKFISALKATILQMKKNFFKRILK